MDRPPRVDVLLARAVEEQITEQRSSREAMELMEERLEQLERTVAALAARLRRWSDPSEVAEEVSTLAEEVSVALGRFHKRLETALVPAQGAVRDALGAEIGELRDQVRGMAEEFRAVTKELDRLPKMLAEHRAALTRDFKKPMRSARRRGRKNGSLATDEQD